VTSEWHVREDHLADFALQTSDPVVAASTEAHLLRCSRCRAALADVSDHAASARRWERLADAVDRPSALGPRWLPQRLRDSGLVRVALGTPALLWAALTATATAATLPAVASAVHQTRAVALLLAIAPLVPIAAVTVAYRHTTDPVGEMALGTPSAGLRLVVTRAVTIGVAALPAGALSGWLCGLAPHVAFAWLLPGLALAAVVLASATTRFDPSVVAMVLGGGWVVAVGSPGSVRVAAAEHLVTIVTAPTTQLAALLVGLAAVTVIVGRRDDIAYRRVA
jgi:hypothetical protein